MTTQIFNSRLDNDDNKLILYCLREYQTFTISITFNINNEIINNINDLIFNNDNFGLDYFFFLNRKNQECLFEKNYCNISCIDVLNGLVNNIYNIQSIDDFRVNNDYQNLLDDFAWINILGRLALN